MKQANSALAFPRNDELKWMLNHSPYIAEARKDDKKQFIDNITLSSRLQ